MELVASNAVCRFLANFTSRISCVPVPPSLGTGGIGNSSVPTKVRVSRVMVHPETEQHPVVNYPPTNVPLQTMLYDVYRHVLEGQDIVLKPLSGCAKPGNARARDYSCRDDAAQQVNVVHVLHIFAFHGKELHRSVRFTDFTVEEPPVVKCGEPSRCFPMLFFFHPKVCMLPTAPKLVLNESVRDGQHQQASVYALGHGQQLDVVLAQLVVTTLAHQLRLRLLAEDAKDEVVALQYEQQRNRVEAYGQRVRALVQNQPRNRFGQQRKQDEMPDCLKQKQR